ncbi:MAG: type II toxin-antitoxin system RelE/ParE family toxin [Armatimonadetes bacterium]|nr:type II toxin-antitoxin system RelE/ParE family toxin [Armatimonadota bacterium]
MKYEVILAQSAERTFRKLEAPWRSTLKQAMRHFLEHEPKRESKSRIKRLRWLRQPQYRLRVDEMRVYYDVNDELHQVEVLDFVLKPQSQEWLEEHGVPE